MSISDDELDLSLDSVFPYVKEPPRPPTPQPTISTFHRDQRFIQNASVDWRSLNIQLVAEHPLWGQYLWNAARSFAAYLDEHPEIYRNGNVLELGAGGALPSLVTVKNGARFVAITDYPDTSLIENIKHNVEQNLSDGEQKNVLTQGYIWGRKTDVLLRPAAEATGRAEFDLIVLSDLIFNHSQHDALLSTCEDSLADSSPSQMQPSVLVFYSHHRPQFAHRDMLFFSKAVERGWKVERVVEERFPPMFPEDSGDETVRSTVHGWRLTKSSNPSQ